MKKSRFSDLPSFTCLRAALATVGVLAFGVLGQAAALASESRHIELKVGGLSTAANVEVAAGTRISPQLASRSALADAPSNRIRYSLDPSHDSIGYFSGEDFVATRVGTGVIRAEMNGEILVSQAISVRPGQLNEILLSISAEQAVGNPWAGTAKLVLLDEFDNLLTDYDLASEPITLFSDTGVLSPSVLNDTLLFDSGVVNFLPVGVTYEGLSARVGVYATNGSITSNTVIVSFNGYDVYAANDRRGETVSIIYAGLPTRIYAVIANGGSLLPYDQGQLKSYFKSGYGGSQKIYFAGHAGGQLHTDSINLVTEGLVPGADTLVLEIDSKYLIAGAVTSTVSYRYFPVDVRGAVSASPAGSSFRPDSVYAGIPFVASFDVTASGLLEPIDSGRVELSLASTVNGPIVSALFSGTVVPSMIDDTTARFSSLPATASPADVTPGTTYVYRLRMALYFGGNLIAVDSTYAGSLTIVPRSVIDIDTGSIAPPYVYERDEVPFAFDILLGGTDSLKVNPNTAILRLQANGYSNSSLIKIPDSVLRPGVNHVTTASKFLFSSNLVGGNVFLSSSFSYHKFGVDNDEEFSTNFNGKGVFVRARPEITILATEAESPNRPHVNTGQTFTINCKLTTSAEMDNLGIQLKSEGKSRFNGDKIIPHLGPNDTVTTSFEVIADTVPNAAEVFTVDIVSTTVIPAPPIDAVEVVTIERPAKLTLVHSLVGTINGVVTPLAGFGLNLRLVNEGDAPITPGVFSLSSDNIPLGIPDPLIDTIDDRTSVSYDLSAPGHDTTVLITLQFTQLPVDSNTGLPAQIDASGFSETVFVTKLDAHLQVDVKSVGSAVAAGGVEKDIAVLGLNLVGTSTLSGVRVSQMEMTVSDVQGKPVDAREIVVIGHTAALLNGNRISVATAGGDAIRLLLSGMDVTPSQFFEVSLQTRFQQTLPHGIRLLLKASDVKAEYITGPLVGQPIQVTGPEGADTILNISFELTGRSFAESFVVKDNPYNPDHGPAEFRYLSGDPEGVELRVFSLDGQEVYRAELLRSATSNAGDPFDAVKWDGRNNSGDLVRNGVYLVVLTGLKSGEQARLKLAVVR